MRRILLMVLRNLLIVPGGWIKLCYRASHVDKYTEEDNYEFLRWIVFRANKGGNVTTWTGEYSKAGWIYVFSKSSRFV